MTRALPAAILFLLSAAAAAEIYKWVDAEGRTQFSDRPRANAQTVGTSLRPNTPPAAAPQDANGNRLGPYSAFEIVSPEANQVLRNTEGTISVSLLLVPNLKEDHRLELTVDGTPVPIERALGTQLNLSGIAFGSHQAQARVLDTQGAVIATTPPMTFHLRKPLPPGVVP